MPMLGGRLQRLNSHDSCMNQTRPDGEPDQAAMLQRISRCNQKKYSERGIHSEDHLLVLGLVGLPAPARRPEGHHHRIDAEDEYQAREYQSVTKKTNARI